MWSSSFATSRNAGGTFDRQRLGDSCAAGIDLRDEIRAGADFIDGVRGRRYPLRSRRTRSSRPTSPPAEKPTIPIRLGSIPHSAARLRTRRMARRPSWRGMGHVVDGARLARQAVFEGERRHPDTVEILPPHRMPSGTNPSSRKPPPGHRITAAPVAFSFGGRNTVSDGIVHALHPVTRRLFGDVLPRFETGRAVGPQRNDGRSAFAGVALGQRPVRRSLRPSRHRECKRNCNAGPGR